MIAHILLVEDDDTTRKMLSFVLTKAGYHVTQAPDGKTAINAITNPDTSLPPLDVVLTDIQMGKIDGIQVMNTAMQQPAPPAVILLTGYASVETAIEALRSGAFDYLRKPCQNTELLACVNRAVEERNARQQQDSILNTLTQAVRQLQEHRTTRNEPPPNQPAEYQNGHTTGPQEHAIAPERYMAFGRVCIDTYRHQVTVDNFDLHLTPHEYALLLYMGQLIGRVLDPRDIVRHTHGIDSDLLEARTLLKPHVRNLRRKLPEGYLVTIRGKGHMLVVPDEEGHSPSSSQAG
jgi:DNA-binding response OmpR family regulator